MHDIPHHQEEHTKLAKLGRDHNAVLPYLKLYILLWHGLGEECCSDRRLLQVSIPEVIAQYAIATSACQEWLCILPRRAAKPHVST
jgi:hypothetical protein